MKMKMYLDNNATTMITLEVVEKMTPLNAK